MNIDEGEVAMLDVELHTVAVRSRQGAMLTNCIYTEAGLPSIGDHVLVLTLQTRKRFALPCRDLSDPLNTTSGGVMSLRIPNSSANLSLTQSGEVVIGVGDHTRTIYSTRNHEIVTIAGSIFVTTACGFLKWDRPIESTRASFEMQTVTDIDPDSIDRREINLVASSEVPFRLTVKDPKHPIKTFTIDVAPSGVVKISGAALDLQSETTLRISAREVTINDRVVSPTREPL